MAKYLVIVESPAKAKTIKKFLGSSYKIEASMGHVRDLPKSNIGIDITNDFEPKYITIRGKGELLKKLRKEVKKADKVYLATDPDREGEAISWHLLYALNLDKDKTSRITFNEITKTAVKKSIKQARDIDMNLVNAQQARRELDRIVGYKISPLLWKKVKKGLSAGRVQSVALKLICDREEDINNFIPKEYWTLDALLSTQNKKIFVAKFHSISNNKIELNSKEDVDKIIDSLKDKEFIVEEIKKAKRIKKPLPPFTTSTLQQEASKVLGFTTQKTMMIAQQLYEGIDIKGEGMLGLVSYIRTDSVRVSDDAYNEAKKYIENTYGKEYNSLERNEYKSKGRTQDAHEAIRPTYINKTADSIKASLSKDQYKLYKLIWERFVASQMATANYKTISVKIRADECIFKSSGSILEFEGFMKVYKSSDDLDNEVSKIPELLEKEKLNLNKFEPNQHFTQPPARFTEASLVKTLEELGVGRPSTYVPTIGTILQRGYVVKENKNFYSTELGEIINEIMNNNFKDIVNVDFTAELEEQLDKVEEGSVQWKDIIRNFYSPFEKTLETAEENINKIEIADEVTDVQCDKCGRNMVIKYGRYGKFLACPGFPDCKNAKPFYEDAGVLCPKCGSKVQIKKTKKGRKYYGCENNPDCDFMSWNKPTGDNCPKCGSFLIEKGTKHSKIICSNQQCGYIKSENPSD